MSVLLFSKDVSFVRHKRLLVDSASVDLEAGSLTVIIGPNGAGKSTLVRLLSGELRPTSGSVQLDHQVLATIAPWQLASKRAVMTQSVEVAFDFTVREIVGLGVDGIGRVASAADRREIIERCLAEADMLNVVSQRYVTLSGGEQRRVQFARALAQLEAGRSMGDKQVLLLDEPVAHLDLRHQFALLDVARRIAARGTAVLIVLHDLNLAFQYADKIILLHNGQVLAQGTPAAVMSSELMTRLFDFDLSLVTALKPRRPLVLPSRWLEQIEGDPSKIASMPCGGEIQPVP